MAGLKELTIIYMGFSFNFFGKQEIRRFNYRPRFYNPEEEARKEMFGDHSKDKKEEKKEYVPGTYVKGSLRDGGYKETKEVTKNQKYLGMVAVLLIFFAGYLAYEYFQKVFETEALAKSAYVGTYSDDSVMSGNIEVFNEGVQPDLSICSVAWHVEVDGKIVLNDRLPAPKISAGESYLMNLGYTESDIKNAAGSDDLSGKSICLVVRYVLDEPYNGKSVGDELAWDQIILQKGQEYVVRQTVN